MREWPWVRIADLDTSAVDVVDITDRAVSRIIRIRPRLAWAGAQTHVTNIFDDVATIDEDRRGVIVVVGIDDLADPPVINSDKDEHLVSDTDICDTSRSARLSHIGDHVVGPCIKRVSVGSRESNRVLVLIDFDDLTGISGVLSAYHSGGHPDAKVI